MSKLLNKPLKVFSLFALIVLMCSIPAYYLVVDYIWLDELDEQNQILKKRVQEELTKNILQEKDIAELIHHWKIIYPGLNVKRIPNTTYSGDSVFTITKMDVLSTNEERERYRVLSSFFHANNQSYHLTAESNVEEVEDTLTAIALITFLFFIFLFLGFIALNRLISKKIWQPFYDTLHKLKLFDLSRTKQIYLSKTDIEEFEELNRELEKVLSENISIFTKQKSFIENASHELQTPLAVLKSKIELFLQNKDLTKEQSEIIQSIELPLGRVSRINKNLLLLAKIENNQFADREKLSVSTLVSENVNMLEDYIQMKELNVRIQLNEDVELNSNKTLVEIVLNNLIINAIIHSTKNTEIIISLRDKCLSISNSGIKALDETFLFNRFVKLGSENNGSGLGLSIVKEICDRYHWQLSYSFSSNTHLFSIQF